MKSSLLVAASAATFLSTLVLTHPTANNSTLAVREVEGGEFPNLQINTYKSPDCKGQYSVNAAQYGLKQELTDTNSYYLTRDLSPGEQLDWYVKDDCTSSAADKPLLAKAYKKGCTPLQTTDHCFQLTFSAPAPAANPVGVNQARCDYHWDGMAHYDVRGKNFDRTKMKADGSGLKDHVGGCLGMKGWHFVMTPQDPNFEWLATFTANTGTKSCVGKAIKDAGGASDGGCSGPG